MKKSKTIKGELPLTKQMRLERRLEQNLPEKPGGIKKRRKKWIRTKASERLQAHPKKLDLKNLKK